MKGSTYSRKVIKDLNEFEDKVRIQKTLKDIDFLNLE